ncbi:E3 ubiquitin-protein ligase znrf1 isoform X2 [Syngnathoides biaculeatus]|uniref:E3 ubiquitin-protein ligase znrf1 isoform X2 n=1 Tax=Syngnathoides biaculeatus TaxID=300417 RepID=UPI002ADD9620|nr:E3 ubiquitin-protein ligase znrf1 isoform X2 [Syngnathoides biaculeatus]
MGGKQSTAGRTRAAFTGVSTDDSAVPPSAHFGHYRSSGTMGLRSRSASSLAAIGIEQSPNVPFGFYTPRDTDSDPAGGGSGGSPAASHRTGYQDSRSGRPHADGVLYLGSRGSLADSLPLHIAPRWFSAHSGKRALRAARCRFKCPVCSKAVASSEMEVHFIMCLSKPRLSYNATYLHKGHGSLGAYSSCQRQEAGYTLNCLPANCTAHRDKWPHSESHLGAI